MYNSIIEKAFSQFVEKVDNDPISNVTFLSANTWCMSSEISKGVEAAISQMLNHEDYFENCLILGACFDKGQEVDLFEHLKTLPEFNGTSTDSPNSSPENTVDVFFGENLTVCLAKDVTHIEDLSLYDTIIHLDVESLFDGTTEHRARIANQVEYVQKMVYALSSGLVILISNCQSGMLAALGINSDHVSAIDVVDLGLPLPQSNDIVTMRNALNSIEMPVENSYETQYADHVRDIFENNRFIPNRTDIGTMKEFGGYMRYDLRKGFPLMTNKYVNINNIAAELKFFNNAMTNVRDLKEMGCNIWDDWATTEGELGPVYGKMQREWEDTRLVEDSETELLDFLESQGYEYVGKLHNSDKLVYQRKIDQITDVVESLKTDPNNRRLVITSFNPGYVPVNEREANVNERLNYLMDDELADTAGNYMDEYEAEGYDSSEEMAQSIIDEKYGEYENLTHEKLDTLGAPRFTVKMTPNENAAVGQQSLPPCHMIYQLGSLPMSMDERLQEYVNSRLREEYFVTSAFASSNHHAMLNREHAKLLDRVTEELGEDCSEDQLNEWLTNEGIPTHYLDLAFYQRSADMFRGVPYNSASYSLQLMLFAKKVGMVPRYVHHYLGDKHVYENHFENMAKLIERVPFAPPIVEIADFDEIADFGPEHITLKNYNHHSVLSAGKMAV